MCKKVVNSETTASSLGVYAQLRPTSVTRKDLLTFAPEQMYAHAKGEPGD